MTSTIVRENSAGSVAAGWGFALLTHALHKLLQRNIVKIDCSKDKRGRPRESAIDQTYLRYSGAKTSP
jgi:hypothetical protein|tara:strand:- start:387 stop:590 length:204 start_codon:yes stop_codon:yes gene_type:complete